MTAYLFVVLSSVMSGMSSATQKLWQKKTSDAGNAPYIFLVVNALSACLIFYAMSGFDLTINSTSLRYAALYGAVVIFSLVLNMAAMTRMNLILCSVFSRGSSMIIWLIGILFFKDELKFSGAVSAVLILISILIPVFGITNGKIRVSDCLIGGAITAVGTMSTLILKFYATEPAKSANSVMFFYTNVFVIVFVAFAAVIGYGFLFERKNLASDLKRTGKFVWIIPLSTLGSNLASVISVYVMKVMPLSLYSIVSYTVGCVVVFVNSKVVFREKCTVSDAAAFVLSAAAALITLI